MLDIPVLDNPVLDIPVFSHFIFFMIFGILVPSNYIGAFILGLVWECIDDCRKAETLSTDFLIQHFKDYQDVWPTDKKHKLVYMIINMGGYYAGNKLRSMSPL